MDLGVSTICPLWTLHNLCEAFDCLPLHGRQDRGVNVHRHRNRGVSEPFLDHLRVYSGQEQH